MSPRLRRRLLLIAVACLVLAFGYQFWLRDSSLVAVRTVSVSGVTTDDAARVRVALTAAARTMTTLHVDREALQRAVAGYPVVKGLDVSSDFPHRLELHVIEYHPAAIAVSDSGRVPVAADGTILRGLPVEGRLPTVSVDGPLGGDLLGDRVGRRAVAVAAAAPTVLRRRIETVARRGDDGYVAELRDGPDLIFGDFAKLAAKWAAAARILADLEARGASYLDLRLPGRPTAGGLSAATVEPVVPASTGETQAAGTATASDPSATATDSTTLGQTATEAASDPSAGTGVTTAPEQQSTPSEPVTGGTGGGATAAP